MAPLASFADPDSSGIDALLVFNRASEFTDVLPGIAPSGSLVTWVPTSTVEKLAGFGNFKPYINVGEKLKLSEQVIPDISTLKEIPINNQALVVPTINTQGFVVPTIEEVNGELISSSGYDLFSTSKSDFKFQAHDLFGWGNITVSSINPITNGVLDQFKIKEITTPLEYGFVKILDGEGFDTSKIATFNPSNVIIGDFGRATYEGVADSPQGSIKTAQYGGIGNFGAPPTTSSIAAISNPLDSLAETFSALPNFVPNLLQKIVSGDIQGALKGVTGYLVEGLKHTLTNAVIRDLTQVMPDFLAQTVHDGFQSQFTKDNLSLGDFLKASGESGTLVGQLYGDVQGLQGGFNLAALQNLPEISNSLADNINPTILNNMSQLISEVPNLINLNRAVNNTQGLFGNVLTQAVPQLVDSEVVSLVQPVVNRSLQSSSSIGSALSIVRRPDGSEVETNIYSNGLKIEKITNKDGSSNTTEFDAQGKIIRQYGYGSALQASSSNQLQSPSSIGSALSIVKRPDGSEVETDIYSNGSKIEKITNKDGSRVVTKTNVDGSVTKIATRLDGYRETTIFDKTGKQISKTAVL